MKAPKRMKTATLNLRVSPDFKERLEEEADETRRSVTNYIEATLWDVWNRKDQVNGGKRRS
ncbi:MAG: toxin-antitoxin system HicB family antitoxin [Acidobacteria bacterium]|nr:toxin-antitoxin system HicB family antitoxin [Acidobacteriota bacterium]MBV9146145.1 toxin-antitoxin system HicB family antitoxin [Acidobacteriota bacterium]